VPQYSKNGAEEDSHAEKAAVSYDAWEGNIAIRKTG